jgi:hypothetical protein
MSRAIRGRGGLFPPLPLIAQIPGCAMRPTQSALSPAETLRKQAFLSREDFFASVFCSLELNFMDSLGLRVHQFPKNSRECFKVFARFAASSE